jgi:hypothetical protein
MLTAIRPTITEIKGVADDNGNPIFDAFERAGEPVSIRHLCESGIKSLMGRDFPPLVPIKIELGAKEIDKKIKKVVDIP